MKECFPLIEGVNTKPDIVYVNCSFETIRDIPVVSSLLSES